MLLIYRIVLSIVFATWIGFWIVKLVEAIYTKNLKFGFWECDWVDLPFKGLIIVIPFVIFLMLYGEIKLMYIAGGIISVYGTVCLVVLFASILSDVIGYIVESLRESIRNIKNSRAHK